MWERAADAGDHDLVKEAGYERGEAVLSLCAVKMDGWENALVVVEDLELVVIHISWCSAPAHTQMIGSFLGQGQ